MQLSEFAIRRPVTVVMVFSAMVLLGLVAMNRIPLLLLPDVNQPVGYVRFGGEVPRSVEEMERDLVKPVEGLISKLPGVRELDVWFGNHGWGFARIHFHPHVDHRFRMVELDEQLRNFGRQFEGNEFRHHCGVVEMSEQNNTLMEVTLTGPLDDPFFTRIDIEDIETRLMSLEGVSNAGTWGGTDHVIEVSLDKDKLTEYRTSVHQIIQRVRSFAGEPVVLGDIDERGRRMFVRFDGQFGSTSEIADVIVARGGYIALRNMGTAEERYRPRERIMLKDGLPSIEFDLEKRALANPIETSRIVRNSLGDINKELPPGYGFSIENDQAEGIVALIQQLTYSALAGVVLALSILFAFIRNWKMVSIICAVIPICVFSSLNMLYFAGLTFNIVTLVGLAVGVGSLIDNSIVVMENIYRHFERTRDAMRSALRGVREVAWAILALTVTGTIVFVPILFAESGMRRRGEAFSFVDFLQEGALAIIIPISVSMMAALMLVPMASARFFAAGGKPAEPGFRPPRKGFAAWFSMRGARRGYLKILKACLRHRVRFVIAIALACLYTYFYSAAEVRREVRVEPERVSSFEVHVYTTRGTKIESTLATALAVKELIEEKVPEAAEITARVEDDDAHLDVELVPAGGRDRDVNQIREDLRPFLNQFPGAEVGYDWRRPSGDAGAPVQTRGRGGDIVIRGPEYGQLQSIANHFSEILRQAPDLRSAYTEAEEGPVQYHFKLDRDASAQYQVGARDVANAIQSGQRRSRLSTIRMNRNGDRIDIVFSQHPGGEAPGPPESPFEGIQDEGLTLGELYTLPVYAPGGGGTVELRQLGSFEKRGIMGFVWRENRERVSRIHFETMPDTDYREIEEYIAQLIEAYPLPAGYRMELEGRGREWNDSMDSLQFIILLGAVLIYMSLAALFESLALPLAILLSLPLSVIGVVWFLVATGTPFEPMMSGLGAVFLMGMLPNSAILMAYTARNMEKQKGYNRRRAIMEAAHHRLRPILMTVSTTILGLLPLAVSPDTVSLWADRMHDISLDWTPFSRVVIGGLISGTLLTLIVVPGFYLIVTDFADWAAGQMANAARLWRKPAANRAAAEFPDRPAAGAAVHHLTRWYYDTPGHSAAARFFSLLPGSHSSARLGFVPAAGESRRRLVKALDGVTFELHPGITGLLGVNGAGKTTLLRLLAGIDQPTRGTVYIQGRDLAREPGAARAMLGYLPQSFGVPTGVTAFEYLDHLALLKGIREPRRRAERVWAALDEVNLRDRANGRADRFSLGMRQRLGLAQALLNAPPVIVLDEPTVGLDPAERVRFRNLLRRMAKDRVIVLSTHLTEDIEHCCGSLAVLHRGRLLYRGGVGEFVETARGAVWTVTPGNEADWRSLREHYFVSGQRQTPEGVSMRILSEDLSGANPPGADPTLEEAFLRAVRAGKHAPPPGGPDSTPLT